MNKHVLAAAAVSLLMGLVCALPASAQQAAPSLDGTWSVKFADGSQGTMTVEKGTIRITLPSVGDLKGRVEQRTDYFESIMDRRGINFLFGYLKAGGIEGKLQESAPCAELNKAFKSGVTAAGSSCQAPFTGVKK